jgi:hypothetical protein
MSRVVAIHQPNFFPWLGYFNKIARSDVFVVLDDAQHQKTGSNWTTRVRLLVAGEAKWAGAPVRHPAHGTVRVNQLRWDDTQPWRSKLLRTITLNYGRCAHFDEAFALLVPLVQQASDDVAAYNLHAIRTIAATLDLATPIQPASAFGVTQVSSERLAALTVLASCDTYLAGGGAQGYQQDEVLRARGLKVLAQDFRMQPYPQRGAGEFVPGLSVIDALMNTGISGTRNLVWGLPA